MSENDQKKMVFGLPRNSAAAFSYLLGPVTGVLFYILEKDPFVRFHALQSIVVFSLLIILDWALLATVILIPVAGFVNIVVFVAWLFLIYQAWQGKEWEVPYVMKYFKKFFKKTQI